jgi:Ca-activated chloride channel homolog
MPHRLAVRLGLVSGLCLVALFSSPSASVQQPDGAPQVRVRPAAAGDADDERFVVNTDLISFNVSVTDSAGRCIAGLPQSAFTVLEGKRAQEISFFGEDDSPITVGIVFDLTGSMTDAKLRRAREALAHFMETSHKDDDYYLVTLENGGAALPLAGTRDHAAVIEMLDRVVPHGKTALYDACYVGVNKVLRGAHRRRALLLISDGQDNNSHFTFDELHDLLTESDVSVYSICVAEKGNDEPTVKGEKILRDISAVTGGRFFQPGSAEEMYEVFERIALELRRQYAIAYRPSDIATDGRWHSLRVKLSPPPGSPRLFARYRGGYYAPAVGRR